MLINREQQTKDQEAEFKTFVESLDLPAFVKEVHVRFGVDYDDDAAMFVTLLVHANGSGDASRERARLGSRVQSALLPVSGDRWPYVVCDVEERESA